MKSLTGSSIKHDFPLAPHTSWKCGGVAKYYAEVSDRISLREIDHFAYTEGLQIVVLGTGTNLLVSDEGVNAVVVRLTGEFRRIAVSGEFLFSGSGATMGALQIFCMKNGLSGIEPCMGIPGTVGAAIVGNAGTPVGCIGDFVDYVDVHDHEHGSRTLDRDECSFVYRSSGLRNSIVLSACFRMNFDSSNSVRDKMLHALSLRRKHPHGRTAGSVFKNPPGDFAGRLIDAAGLKGYRQGGAYVSTQHANFVVSENGKSSDIYEVILHCRRTVFEKFGVVLEPEVRFWGVEREMREVWSGESV